MNFYQFGLLAARRQSLLEAAYRGVIDLAAWQALISDYLAIGAEYNAAYCVRKAALFLAANRGGAAGRVDAFWNGERTSFEERTIQKINLNDL